MTSTNITLHVIAGTTKKSRDTKAMTWFCRSARHVGDGGFRNRTRYFSTVDCATSMPSLRSSPTRRGAPQVGLAYDMFRIRPCTSREIAGGPGVRPWLNCRQCSRKPFALSGDDRMWLDEDQRVLPSSPEARESGPEHAITRVEIRPATRTLIDGHLMLQGRHFEVQRSP